MSHTNLAAEFCCLDEQLALTCSCATAAANAQHVVHAGEDAQEKLARCIGACKLVVLDVSQNQLVSRSCNRAVHLHRQTSAQHAQPADVMPLPDSHVLYCLAAGRQLCGDPKRAVVWW